MRECRFGLDRETNQRWSIANDDQEILEYAAQRESMGYCIFSVLAFLYDHYTLDCHWPFEVQHRHQRHLDSVVYSFDLYCSYTI